MLQRGFTPESVSKALCRRQPGPDPEPPAKVTSGSSWLNWNTGVKLLELGARAGVAYYRHQRYWAGREARVLEAAKNHQGWLTQAQFLQALEFHSGEVNRVRESLCRQGLCQIYPSRSGSEVYIFESLLPPVCLCEYCDQQRPAGHTLSCPGCGAP